MQELQDKLELIYEEQEKNPEIVKLGAVSRGPTRPGRYDSGQNTAQ